MTILNDPLVNYCVPKCKTPFEALASLSYNRDRFPHLEMLVGRTCCNTVHEIKSHGCIVSDHSGDGRTEGETINGFRAEKLEV